MDSGTVQAPLTFDDYLLEQAWRSFSSGPLLHNDVEDRLPLLLSRMAQARAVRARAFQRRGLSVPAAMFLAVTGQCNYRCGHCYTSGYDDTHMPVELADRILSQAYELGVSLIVVTGGEPLLHRDFFALPPRMPDVPFLVFTNGSLVPEFLGAAAASPNMLWVVSVDGPKPWNDVRRGAGSFDAAAKAMQALKQAGLPFGFSATLSADNAGAALDPEFVSAMATRGCRAGFILEQIPGPRCTPSLGQQIAAGLQVCRPVSPIPLVAFPADEVRYGGCQAGGHGIVHISPDGFVEPCPAAHIAVDSLRDVSLEGALSSQFFEEFRRLKENVSTGAESCAYAEHEAEVQAGLFEHGCRATAPGSPSVPIREGSQGPGVAVAP